MLKLAKRIANFVWDIDPYEARDNYDTFGELVAETIRGLADEAKRTAIYEWLMDCETETEEAQRLAKEVCAL